MTMSIEDKKQSLTKELDRLYDNLKCRTGSPISLDTSASGVTISVCNIDANDARTVKTMLDNWWSGQIDKETAQLKENIHKVEEELYNILKLGD